MTYNTAGRRTLVQERRAYACVATEMTPEFPTSKVLYHDCLNHSFGQIRMHLVLGVHLPPYRGTLDGQIDAMRAAFEAVVRVFGPWGTIGIAFAALVVTGVRRVYKDRITYRLAREALDEKERTIIRLSNQERELRMILFQIRGLTPEQTAIVFGIDLRTGKDTSDLQSIRIPSPARSDIPVASPMTRGWRQRLPPWLRILFPP